MTVVPDIRIGTTSPGGSGLVVQRLGLGATRRSIGYLDLANEGCTLDGIVDDSAAFAAAVTKAATQGKELVWTGNLRITSGVSLSGQAGGRPLRLRGDGPNLSQITSDIPAGAAVPTLLDLGGYGSLLTASASLTADAVQGTRTLTMASTTAYAVGDSLLLSSALGWTYSDKGAVRGELVRIVGKTGTTLTLAAPIDDTYATANTAAVAKVLHTAGSLVEGFKVVDLRPNEGGSAMFRFAGHRDVTARDLVLENGHGSGLIFHHTEDWTVDNVHFHDFTNDPANSRYGYGVLAYGSSRSGRVVNSIMRGGRHLFTTGSDGAHPGIPRHIEVAHCQAMSMDNAGFDSHFEGEFIHHHDCHVLGTRAFGFQVRAPRSTVTDSTVKGCYGAGLWVRAPQVKVRGFDADDVHDGSFDSEGTGATTWPGQGIRLASGVGTHDADDCRLADVEVRNTDQDSIYVNANGFRLRGADLKSPGRLSNSIGLRLALASSTGHLIDGLSIESATNGITTAGSVTGRLRGYRYKAVTSPGTLTADAGWTTVADV